jgi:hypothetical protein
MFQNILATFPLSRANVKLPKRGPLAPPFPHSHTHQPASVVQPFPSRPFFICKSPDLKYDYRILANTKYTPLSPLFTPTASATSRPTMDDDASKITYNFHLFSFSQIFTTPPGNFHLFSPSISPRSSSTFPCAHTYISMYASFLTPPSFRLSGLARERATVAAREIPPPIVCVHDIFYAAAMYTKCTYIQHSVASAVPKNKFA